MSESTEYWQDKTGLYLNDLIDTQANRAMIEAMRAMHNRLLLMEAQSQAAESPAPPASETPSLPAIETQEGTPLTSTTSSTWLYPASRDGLIKRSVQQDIWDWLSSLRFHGEPQAVEITATLTLKGTIPPSGSLSQSTVAPNPGVNGHAGVLGHD